MGLGDQLIATGLARGAAVRGKRIAFGDGRQIIWSAGAEEVFKDNPNIARPGTQQSADVEWFEYYKGKRGYNSQAGDRWVWNMAWRCKPGEMFFDAAELEWGARLGQGFVLIEPNVPAQKSVAPNKQWPTERYQLVADRLRMHGLRVVQPLYAGGKFSLQRVERVQTTSFRDALAVLSNAALYIGCEGGLHHGAAAVGTKAVVLFGGFIPPQVTGYDAHANLTGGAEACGSLKACPHCAAAMDKISADEVHAAAMGQLRA